MNDLQTRNFSIGILVVIIVVRILKNVIKQPRPIMTKGATWGMPSSRAATLFFICAYLILVDNLSKTTQRVLIGCALLGCIMKYVSKEHSLLQLIIGAIIGLIMAKLIV